MTIPDYQSIMLPLLEFAQDGSEHTIKEAVDHIAARFSTSAEERRDLLPSGRQFILDNRVGWACTYLKKAGLLDSPRRSLFRITDLGVQQLMKKPGAINIRFLEQFPSFVEFRRVRKDSEAGTAQEEQVVADELSQTPEELVESGVERIRRELVQDLLTSVKQASPEFFERLVVKLLVAMGYGGSSKDAGAAVGRSGDGGVDGIIKETG
jgi:restriction system protein